MHDPEGAEPAAAAAEHPSNEGTDRSARAATSAPPDPLRPGSAHPPGGVDLPGVSRWMAEAVPEAVLPLSCGLIPGGRSNLTFAVTDAAGHRYVLRRPPGGRLLPTAHDMGREHRIISALRPAGIPVPRARGYCDDPAVNGAPFYVMDFVDGHVLRTEADATAAFDVAGRRRVSASLVDTLAALHAVDPDAVGLGDLARRDGYIARQLKRWSAQYRSSRDQGGPDVADLDAVHARLLACVPEQGPAGIVHGDYRLDNTVVRADGRVAAVLDWELCTLGDVLADVGQLLVYWTEPGELPALEHAGTGVEGFFSRAEVAERYASVSGRSLAPLDYYVTFAYWKVACILEGVYTRYLTGAMGDDGFDYRGYPDAIGRLAGQARVAAERLGR